MSAPFWVHDLAERFWKQAETDEPFPRSLRRPIARSLPLSVVSLPRLRVSAIDEWLRKQGAVHCVNVHDRPLRACLVASGGHGLVFVDGTDPDDEQRFSLAHELAHFLRGYWAPRLLTRERLGPEVAQVLDGARAPRVEERVISLLANVPIDSYVHVMDRDGRMIADPTVVAAERDADRLAFELLAPEAVVLATILSGPTDSRPAALHASLRREYGLPAAQAAQYATLLRPRPRDGGFVSGLKLVR